MNWLHSGDFTVSVKNGMVTLTNVQKSAKFEISKDNGETWSECTNSVSFDASEDDEVLIKKVEVYHFFTNKN